MLIVPKPNERADSNQLSALSYCPASAGLKADGSQSCFDSIGVIGNCSIKWGKHFLNPLTGFPPSRE